MNHAGAADGETKRPVDGIRDNSFLIEEAYNQEAGVVQHIFTGLFSASDEGLGGTRAWDMSFTQEWPVFSQKHQLSYTLPFALREEDERHHGGIGDALLNYRYQFSMEEDLMPAISPRVSLIFPSGDEERGLGSGVLGYQLNLPISKTLSDRVYVNFNLGLTYLPNAEIELSNGKHSAPQDVLGYNVGGSVIFAITEDFHFLLESLANFDQVLNEVDSRRGPRGRRDSETKVVISPGVRWAWNLRGDLQVVPGVAFPIGLTEDTFDYGMFLYLSVEHPFMKMND